MEAIKLDPGYGDAYYLLARYYQRTGESQLAKDTFAKFEEIKKNPTPSPYGVRRW
jgi:Tfp pilus assembly protein PilF